MNVGESVQAIALPNSGPSCRALLTFKAAAQRFLAVHGLHCLPRLSFAPRSCTISPPSQRTPENAGSAACDDLDTRSAGAGIIEMNLSTTDEQVPFARVGQGRKA